VNPLELIVDGANPKRSKIAVIASRVMESQNLPVPELRLRF